MTRDLCYASLVYIHFVRCSGKCLNKITPHKHASKHLAWHENGSHLICVNEDEDDCTIWDWDEDAGEHSYAYNIILQYHVYLCNIENAITFVYVCMTMHGYAQQNAVVENVCRRFDTCHIYTLVPHSLIIHSFIHSIIQSFNHSIIQSFNHSLIRSFNHSIVQSFAHSLIQSFNRSLIHS
jgi:WD40 repeat protein